MKITVEAHASVRHESRLSAPLPAPALPRGAKARSGAAGLGARGDGAVAACSRKNLSSDALALPKLLCTTMRPRSQRLSCRCALSDCARTAVNERKERVPHE